LRDDGITVMMMYQNREPVIISLDNYFFADRNGRHAFVHMSTNSSGEKEIWPLLIEKAYAKLYGSFSAIEGGLVDIALADLCNGAPKTIDLTDSDVKVEIRSGQMWKSLNSWYN